MSEGFRGGGGRGFNPDEPRDAHGRWVASGGTPAARSSWRHKPLGSTTRAERAAALLRHSFLSLPDRLRTRFAHSDPATIDHLSELMRLWSRADLLDDELFHAIHLRNTHPPIARHLRAAVMLAATASNNGEMAEASRHLAAAVREIGPHRLPHQLSGAVAQALSVPDLTPQQIPLDDAVDYEGLPTAIPVSAEDEPPSTIAPEKGDTTLDEDGLPKLPTNRPPTLREANKRGRALTERLAPQYHAGLKTRFQVIVEFLELIRLGDWLVMQLVRHFTSFDKPKSLEELIAQEKNDNPKKQLAYETHHIVEVTRGSDDPSANRNVFSSEQLESDTNKVRIPYYAHRRISDYYQTPDEELGGLTPRKYLRGRSWEEQYEFGLKTLRRFGVLK